MTSVIVVPAPDSIVDRADVAPLIAAIGAGRDIRCSYVLGVDEPRILTEILRSGDALLIYNCADQTLMDVAPGVAREWLRAAGA